MQRVEDKFYIWYNWGAMGVGGLLTVVAIASWIVPGLAPLHDTVGFTPITIILGIAQIVYGLIFFQRQSNVWVGGFFAAMLLAANNIALIHNSGQFHSWFMVWTAILIFTVGIYGLYGLVGAGFMTTLYYIVVATGPGEQKPFDPLAIGAMLLTFLIITLSYMFWRRFYVDQESRRVNQLTGQLKSKQQQAEILIQSIADAIIVTDTEGQISLLNPAAGVLTGWPVDEALGMDVQLVVRLAQEDGKGLAEGFYPFNQVLKTGQQYNDVLRMADQSGTKNSVVSLVISPVILPNSTETAGTVAVLRDVSSNREEEHRRADFISTASHEMRTPVAAIEGYLALALNEKVSKVDSKAREFLVKAHESTRRLGTLFQDLLTSAKAEDGRLVNHPTVTEMGSYLEQITEGLRFAAEKKGLLMDFTIGASPENTAASIGSKVLKPLYYAHIDQDRMHEVITNLFDNAVKYTESGRIIIGLTGNENIIQFFIRDTGHGIPTEDVPHLFQKFYRVDNTSTRIVNGTGLGLFICRKIIELYNGHIWVESELDKGSTFYINLPRLSPKKVDELRQLEKQTMIA